MADNKEKKQEESVDSASFGGSSNRLSYEKSHSDKKDPPVSDWTTRLGLFLILFAVFALIGIWIVWYFDSSLARIFSKEKKTDDLPSAQQTYIVSILDE